MKAKSVIMGAVSRGGEVRLRVVPDGSAMTVNAFLERNVAKTARLITDNAATYLNAASAFQREAIEHKTGYVRGDVHINGIETLWGHIKRSLAGTQKTVSKKELQAYLDVFAFHYNNRHNDNHRFGVLLGTVLRAVK